LIAALWFAPSQNVTFQWLMQPALMRFTVAGAVTELSKKLTHCFPVSLVGVQKHAWSTLLGAGVYSIFKSIRD